MSFFTATWGPFPPSLIDTLRVDSGWTRVGVIVTRAYPAKLGITEQDYREILSGGAARVGQLWVPGHVPGEAARILDQLACDKVETHNVACNAGRAAILNWIGNNVTSGNIGTTVSGTNYVGCNVFAVGTGNISSTPATASDTQLLSEQFRKQVTNSTATVSGNSVDVSTLFLQTEANFTYTEAGIFGCVGTLPGSANTGTMYGHAAYSYTKTNSISLSNDYFFYAN